MATINLSLNSTSVPLERHCGTQKPFCLPLSFSLSRVRFILSKLRNQFIFQRLLLKSLKKAMRKPVFGSTSPFGFVLGLNSNKSGNKLIPLMMGGDFLKAVLKNNDYVNKELQNTCSYSPPSRYSVANILDKLNIASITEPNESQKINFVVQCMRRMISIADYEHKSKVTSANSIMVSSSDPFFQRS